MPAVMQPPRAQVTRKPTPSSSSSSSSSSSKGRCLEAAHWPSGLTTPVLWGRRSSTPTSARPTTKSRSGTATASTIALQTCAQCCPSPGSRAPTPRQTRRPSCKSRLSTSSGCGGTTSTLPPWRTRWRTALHSSGSRGPRCSTPTTARSPCRTRWAAPRTSTATRHQQTPQHQQHQQRQQRQQRSRQRQPQRNRRRRRAAGGQTAKCCTQ